MTPFILLLVILKLGSCARILGIIPTASFSHQIPHRPLWRELHARGHHLTIITTDPMNDPTLTNLTEININFIYQLYKEHNFTQVLTNESIPYIEKGKFLSLLLEKTTTLILESAQVQNLIHNKDMKFDLMFLEAVYVPFLAFSWKFNCPTIGVYSMDAMIFDHFVFGNSINPVLHPEQNLIVEDVENLTFWERVKSVTTTTLMISMVNFHYFPEKHQQMKKYFGEDLPPIREIHKNMSMLFIHVNPVLFSVRSVTMNTIAIGDGMHIEAPKPLPKELQEFFDGSKKGAIYFSLGSNVNSKVISNSTLKVIIDTFSELPYNVLWKLDTEIPNRPSNVKITKWAPQQDVLRHPNIKLFITQAGLQSLQESLNNSIPMICIPFFGDQFQNSQRMAKHGVAITLNKNTMSTHEFKAAVLEVINNPKYKETAKALGEILHDNPMTGLEKAVWWTEYVLRHKGAKYLRSHGINLHWAKYYLLDVLALYAVVILTVLFLLFKLFSLLIRFIYNIVFVKKMRKQKEQ